MVAAWNAGCLAGALLLATSSAYAVATGQLVHITRTTPVFKQPMAKAPVLADVDPGTLLVVKSVSPKGTWLLLEDEDGNAGWVPANRTDYAEHSGFTTPTPKSETTKTPSAPKTPLKASDPEVELPDRENVQKGDVAADDPMSTRFELTGAGHLTFRDLHTDPNGNTAYGLTLAWLMPLAPLWSDHPRVGRRTWMGFESGWLVAFNGSRYSGGSFPLRYRMLNRGPGSSWGYGPDFGMTYYHTKAVPDADASSVWSFNFGYRVGWYAHDVFSSLRLAADLKHSPRLSLELALGYAF